MWAASHLDMSLTETGRVRKGGVTRVETGRIKEKRY